MSKATVIESAILKTKPLACRTRFGKHVYHGCFTAHEIVTLFEFGCLDFYGKGKRTSPEFTKFKEYCKTGYGGSFWFDFLPSTFIESKISKRRT